jgi:hypothetical protein
VRRGAEYTVGEAGAEVFVPNGYSAGGGSGNITVQKIEINVPSHFTEEKMIRELKQQLATGDIIKRTRTK